MPQHPIKIAVASGKGGTGKTTVSTSLALSRESNHTHLVDCDVEAPNAHLFFAVEETEQEIVTKRVPVVDFDRCTYCGKCAEVCQYHAISVMNRAALAKQDVFIFPNLCHACGACTYICPERAIKERPEQIGKITTYSTQTGLNITSGEMDIGTPMPTPIIKAAQKKADRIQTDIDLIIYDSPPGNSCAVVETIKEADYVVLVTEPTPFGLHDLKLAVELTQNLGKPAGVILNRADIGSNAVQEYLEQNGIPVLLKIPFQQEIAQNLSRGVPLAEQSPQWKESFTAVLTTIIEEVAE